MILLSCFYQRCLMIQLSYQAPGEIAQVNFLTLSYHGWLLILPSFRRLYSDDLTNLFLSRLLSYQVTSGGIY